MAATRNEIAAKLTSLGVEVTAKATKDELLELLLTADLKLTGKPAVPIGVDESVREALRERAKIEKQSMRVLASNLLRQALADPAT